MSDELRFDPDDARLTAFALGELQGEEHAMVAALVERDADARRFVEEVRGQADALRMGFASEDARPAKRNSIRQVSRRAILITVAAVGLAFAGVALLTDRQREESTSNARSLLGRAAPVPESASPMGALGYAGPIPAPREGAIDRRVQMGYLSGPDSHGTYRGAGDSTPPSDGPRVRIVTSDSLVESAESNTERYAAIIENAFRRAADEGLSTFSIDVDTASYANCRRFLNAGQLPPPAAVRLEEFVNAFRYSYPEPDGDAPFSATAEVASCPWAPTHRLVRIGLKGKSIDMRHRPAANLVFLIDVSGSMNEPDKLPLLQHALRLLVEQVEEKDKIAMVVYAGASGLVLPATSGANKTALADAIDRLRAGGSTNGAAGIELAYQVAAENFVKGGINRVILATDGDFNVGVTDEGSLVKLIEEKRESGVFLSVLGFGAGNLNDSGMEKLADHGNGQYAYIDSPREARRVLVEQAGGTLVTIAKDVKIQVEFNPAEVEAWRQLGYENRVLAAQDFNDDKKDAGEIGAGITVTALYEIVPKGVAAPEIGSVDPKRYTHTAPPSDTAFSGELMFLKLRYKAPDGDQSRMLATPIRDAHAEWTGASADFRFATAVAGFAMLLQHSQYAGALDFTKIRAIAAEARGDDANGERAEFLQLVAKAQELSAGK